MYKESEVLLLVSEDTEGAKIVKGETPWNTLKILPGTCEHLKSSPLFFMCRHLNGKQVKQYGKRNAEYMD